MSVRRFFGNIWIDAVTLVVVFVVFIVPFVFIFLTAAKTSQEAALFQFTWPTQFQLLENIQGCAGIWGRANVPGAVEQHDADGGLGDADRVDLGDCRLRYAAPPGSSVESLPARSCWRG